MAYWTNKELARLKEICAKDDVYASFLHEFPGRTIGSLRFAAKRNGFEKKHLYPGRPPTVRTKILELLASRDMRMAEIAQELGIREVNISEILQRLKEAGKVYIHDRRTMVWASCERVREQELAASPFAAAAGMVQAPSGSTGRIYRHLWDREPNERAAA